MNQNQAMMILMIRMRLKVMKKDFNFENDVILCKKNYFPKNFRCKMYILKVSWINFIFNNNILFSNNINFCKIKQKTQLNVFLPANNLQQMVFYIPIIYILEKINYSEKIWLTLTFSTSTILRRRSTVAGTSTKVFSCSTR